MPTTASPVRERILDAATRRYYADGIRAVSADRLIAEAGVSKVTFYRHFPTKDDLITAYLTQQVAAVEDALTAKRAELTDDPAGVLEWYAESVGSVMCTPGFRGCAFINAAAELPRDHPASRVVRDHRTWLIGQFRELLTELGVADVDGKAEQLMMLRDGAMVAGYVGDSAQAVSATLVTAGRAVIGR
ncbi:TetR/AcrR family transcriptional regulator [Aeromicrobium panaciterrae]|uniref:TetR/AcrR family transcriptional regulator n=1 Tax=Aeromicrobium panaciterrae TaxID=363861 RepID=UPI0031D75194